MTSQCPECLIHRNLAYDMYSFPLERLLRYLNRSKRPQFDTYSTACYRGYIGIWEIYRGKLWLVDLKEQCWPHRASSHTAADAFPHARLPLFAKWCSEDLRCVEGNCISSALSGVGMSDFERDRLIFVEKGEVVGEQLRINPPNAVYYNIAPDGTRTFADAYNNFSHLHSDLYVPDETPRGLRYWIAEGEDLIRQDNSDASRASLASYFAEEQS